MPPIEPLHLPDSYRFGLRISEQGTVMSIGDGIVWVGGLPSAMMDEMLRLQSGYLPALS